MASLIVSAVAKWNGAALKKGQKDITSFQRSTLNLAKAFATAFSIQKITQFGKASVQAFMADEKAAKSLEIALKNTGNGFATIATEGFISRMQQTYRVLDDELRPAFQTLLTATGSITKAQEGLQLALDVSAGTTKDLAAVSQALARGYAGNTQGLSRLNAGLDKAILKTGDMDKITGALTAKFSGQALGALNTYAKKMDALTIAAANSKEIIGKGLLDSIDALSGSEGINAAADAMETLSQNVADTLYGFTLLLAKVEKVSEFLTKTKSGGGLLAGAASGALIGGLAGGPGGALVGGALGLTAARATQLTGQYGKSAREAKTPFSATSMYFTAESAERAKNTAIIKKNTAAELAKLKQTNAEKAAKDKALAEQKDLDELKKKFDVDRINLETALANSTDEAEKTRIRSLLTIMDDDAKAAGKRLAELDKANADRLRLEYMAAISIGDLGEAARLAALGVSELRLGGAPLSQYDRYKDSPTFQAAIGIESQLALDNSEAALAEATAAAAAAEAAATEAEAILAEYMATIDRINSGNAGAGSGGSSGTTVINFNNPIGTEQFFTDAVQKAVQANNRYGGSNTYAGAIPTL
jgi:hypothetical protein